METYELSCHPDTPPLAVRAIKAGIGRADANWLTLRWRIEGSGSLVVPPLAGKGRGHDLWQTTCFELFLKTPDSASYVELNLSPSERWAAYDFDAYRDGMHPRAMPRDPVCTMRRGKDLSFFEAALPIAGLPSLPWQLGLTAVIEEEGGRKSYWALAHAPGKPDFHAPTCFAATLPAPNAS